MSGPYLSLHFSFKRMVIRGRFLFLGCLELPGMAIQVTTRLPSKETKKGGEGGEGREGGNIHIRVQP